MIYPVNTVTIDGVQFVVDGCVIKAVLHSEDDICWSLTVGCESGVFDGVAHSPSIYSEELPGLVDVHQFSQLSQQALSWEHAYNDETDEPNCSIVLGAHTAFDTGELRFSSSDQADQLVMDFQGTFQLSDRPESGNSDVMVRCRAAIRFGGVYIRADDEGAARAMIGERLLLNGLRFEHNPPPAWSAFIPG